MNCHCTAVTIPTGAYAVYQDGLHTATACDTTDDHLAARRAVFGSYAEEALRSSGS
jgi:hypothetical protein